MPSVSTNSATSKRTGRQSRNSNFRIALSLDAESIARARRWSTGVLCLMLQPALSDELTLPQAADDSGREEIDTEDESNAQPQQPAVGMKKVGEQRHADQRLVGQPQQVLQVVLREHQQDRADRGAIDRAHAADHDHQED